ncbi:MAG: hypothetical protein JO237_01965, partial [Pseudolabrys sp.]|nr:hypothetical protein [Pseudolabrys sp.]
MARQKLDTVVKAARNERALILFGRAVVSTLIAISATLGFLAGVQFRADTYNPHTYAIGVSALFFAACACVAWLLYCRRVAKV